MAVNKRAVKLFYDVFSPYSYLGFELLTRYNKQWKNMDLQLKPVLVGGIFNKSGNTAPGFLPAKAKYMKKDIPRLSKYHDIEFKCPKDIEDVLFRKTSVKAMRLLTAVSMEHPSLLETVTRQLYRRIWVQDEDFTENSSLKEALLASKIADDTADKLVAMITENQIKEALRKATDGAIESGAFGVPTYIVEHNGKPQLMFGTDRLCMLAYYLGEDMSVSP